MKKLFIVRPFGNKAVYKKDKDTGNVSTIQFDFDKVEKELIRPAAEAAGLEGGNTGEVFESGDIREDMFSELLLADVVIADITIYNANVFYELGIRHALRDKRTILIKSPGLDDTPFDIIGYRYHSYNKDDPGASLNDLKRMIADTMIAERKDSPVFNMLPALKEQDTEKFLAVPEEFAEEARLATSSGMIGKLKLLADEAQKFSWEVQANRLLGQSFFKLKLMEDARLLWERVKDVNNHDLEANDRLSTIYQRLADTETNSANAAALLEKSDIANEIILKNYNNLDIGRRAEVFALKGRNAKTRWVNEWKELAGDERELQAMGSKNLEEAFENYDRGFYENLNHYYAGINALGLLTVIITLAKKFPDQWGRVHDDEDDSDKWKVEKLENRQKRLVTVLQFSLDAERKRLKASDKKDIWFDITAADFIFLTSTDPQKVALTYSQALKGADSFPIESAKKQVKLYESLNVLSQNVEAALGAIPAVKELWENIHYLLFTGHMVDKEGRKEPRFPASKEMDVKKRIEEEVDSVMTKLKPGTSILGIAGGACGGDILFHEICKQRSIKTQLLLAMPMESFIPESVSFAGPAWIERFDKIYDDKGTDHFVLCEKKELPRWLQKKNNYTIWERNNLWELNTALVKGGRNMTLIALWDGKGGDGPGGTADMINQANARGSKVIVIEMNKI